MKRFYILLFLLILCCSAQGNNELIIEDDTFINLYCDIVSIADLMPANKRTTFVDSIFTVYDVSQESFEHTLEHYKQNPERWSTFMNDVITELENRVKKLENIDINADGKQTDD